MPLSPPFALRPCLALLLLSPSLALAGKAVPLTPTTITATRTEQAVDSVPSTVSVQTREQLDRQNVNNIKELVRYEPGVSVGGAGQRAGITGYNIRGIDGNRILTQIDGVELPNDFFSGPYAQTHRNYVDPDIVKRVEILRGPDLGASDAVERLQGHLQGLRQAVSEQPGGVPQFQAHPHAVALDLHLAQAAGADGVLVQIGVLVLAEGGFHRLASDSGHGGFPEG